MEGIGGKNHAGLANPDQVERRRACNCFTNRSTRPSYNWVRLVFCDDDPATPSLARSMAAQDESDPILIS